MELKDLCRLCQKTNGDVFLTKDKTLCENIEIITKINVLDDPEHFPKTICLSCKSIVETFKNFLDQCLTVEKALRSNVTSIESQIEGETTPGITLTENDSPIVNHDKFTCQICTRTFKNENYLTKHLKTKHQIEKTSDNNPEIDKFENIFIKTENPSCDEDESNFEQNTNNEILKNDVKIEQDPLENNFDGVNVEYLLEENIKNKLQCYTCVICTKKFSSRAEFRRHEKHHVGIKHKCPVENCDKTYSTLRSINSHILRDHKGVNPYLCTLCGKGFVNTQTLKNHEKMHLGQKDFSCEICSEKFYTQSNLYVHRKVNHLGCLNFCSQCPRSFASKSSLKRHEIQHTGIKNFKCDIVDCESEFFTKRELDWHISRVHKEERNFNCNICFKSFNTRYKLNLHSLIHSGQKPFPCDFPGCEKRFREKRKMRLHLKQHYKVPSLQEIMDMELALAMYRSDNDQWKCQKPDDMATRMTKQKWFEAFPDLTPILKKRYLILSGKQKVIC